MLKSFYMIRAMTVLLFWLGSCCLAHADPQGDPDRGHKLSLFFDTSTDILSLSHGHAIPLAVFPDRIPTLDGLPIDTMLALTSILRNSEGIPVGVASELEEFPKAVPENTPMTWDTSWTLMLKGRGSLYLYQQEIMILDDVKIFSGAIASGQTWEGDITHPTTYGPLPGRYGLIKGGTGEFEGASGRFQEIVTLQKFTPEGFLHAQVELRLELVEKQ